jgi:hypothetical protein
MLSSDFLAHFKSATETMWRDKQINPTLCGFQFQQGTRWNPGLPDAEIADYEDILGVRFPDDFRSFLRAMNGTDIPTLNTYGYNGEPARQSVGVYSYPRDIEVVKRRMGEVSEWRPELAASMAEQGFDLAADADLAPIYIHRFVVCTSDLSRSPVLSINDGSDAIVYGNSLKEYLENEFLRDLR